MRVNIIHFYVYLVDYVPNIILFIIELPMHQLFYVNCNVTNFTIDINY